MQIIFDNYVMVWFPQLSSNFFFLTLEEDVKRNNFFKISLYFILILN